MKQKVEELIQAFQDDDWEVRRNAAYALGEIGPEAKGAVPALRQALQNQDEVGVRVSVAYALEQIGTSEAIKAAVPALIQAFQDDDWEVRNSAAYALRQIRTPEALKAVEEYQSS